MPAKTRTKPKRGFMDGYRTYDTSQGFGSVEDWMRAAEAIGADPHFVPLKGATPLSAPLRPGDPDLILLKLEALPGDEAALKSAMRRALIPAHPDHGGSREAVEAVTNAWHRLRVRLVRRQAR